MTNAIIAIAKLVEFLVWIISSGLETLAGCQVDLSMGQQNSCPGTQGKNLLCPGSQPFELKLLAPFSKI